jgi:Cu(I)/Ag(I) efflux system membrane fusion protein
MDSKMTNKQKISGTLAKLTGKHIIAIVIILLVAGFWLGRLGRPQGPAPEKTTDSSEAKPEFWTCSMHPHYEMLEPGTCPSCGMDLIPLIVDDSTDSGSIRELVVSEEAKKLMDIEVAPVERKFVDAPIRMTGKVDFDETNLAYITAWVGGRLDKLYVDYKGVPVNKGDHMVYLYSPELISAQEELLQALKAVKNMKRTELGVMQEMTAATVDAVREKLRLWGVKPEQIAEIEKTGKVTDHMTIYSPTSGIVIHKNVVEGMYVETGTKIYTIADLSKIWVILDAYESDLEWIRYGQKVEFTTISNPGLTFKGTISFIDPILNEKTRTVKVRVNVDNSAGKLKPGMFIKAVVSSKVAGSGRVMDAALEGKWICPMHPEIIKDDSGKCDICKMPLVKTETLGYASDDPSKIEKPLVIPVTAALITGTRAVVYVRTPDTDKPTFEGREIVLGPRAGGYYLVRSGLKEGDLVVVNGNFKIDSSLQIMAKPSMMTPQGGASSDSEIELPALTKFQMKTVIAKAKEVENAASTKDLAQRRAAFKQFAKALVAVDSDLLSGEILLLWREYLMRLGNDAVEGIAAKTLENANHAARSLSENISSFQTKFGLARKDTAANQPKVNDLFRTQLADVFNKYFAMQQALASDDPALAAKSASNMSASLKEVDMKLLTGADHVIWMNSETTLKDAAKKSTDTKDIEAIRKNFNLISQQLKTLAARFGSVTGKPLYVAHCPMAFNNTGADWLQMDKKILNPYFGASMLQCGSIEEVVSVKKIWK